MVGAEKGWREGWNADIQSIISGGLGHFLDDTDKIS